jgi:hypothetical protein
VGGGGTASNARCCCFFIAAAAPEEAPAGTGTRDMGRCCWACGPAACVCAAQEAHRVSTSGVEAALPCRRAFTAPTRHSWAWCPHYAERAGCHPCVGGVSRRSHEGDSPSRWPRLKANLHLSAEGMAGIFSMCSTVRAGQPVSRASSASSLHSLSSRLEFATWPDGAALPPPGHSFWCACTPTAAAFAAPP